MDLQFTLSTNIVRSLLCKINLLYDLAAESGFRKSFAFHVLLVEMFSLEFAIESHKLRMSTEKANCFVCGSIRPWALSDEAFISSS